MTEFMKNKILDAILAALTFATALVWGHYLMMP
jgi:hypothetical protein